MIDIILFVVAAFLGACGAMRLLENLPHYRHQRRERAMCARVEARRRAINDFGGRRR